MNATLLLRLLLWDVRVQSRERIYLFTVFTTAAFSAVVALLPEQAPPTVVTAILLLDPAVVGMGFVGGLVLLERSQRLPPALAVTPATPAHLVIAKFVTFAALTVAGGLAIVVVAWWPPSVALLLRMTLALTFTGVLAVLGGIVMVATANSLNHLIARAFPVSILVDLPLLAHFGIVDGWVAWLLFGLSPGHAMLRALLWAADPSAVTTTELLYAFGYMALLSAVLFRWALSLQTRTIGYAGS